MMKQGEALRTLIAGVALLALTAPAFASAVSDLEGARAAGALDDMARRGYVQTGHHYADGGEYSYWWNSGSKSCIRLLSSDGRIAATKTSPATDCGQRVSGGGNDAAAVAIAAAAAIGVAALASKSHHRDDREYTDANQLASFERGHRDGLYGQSYNNYDNSNDYRSGYQSGVEERNQQTRYRNYNRYSGGYGQQVNLADLDYQDKRWAEGQLASRGFSRTGGYELPGGGHSSSWWNPGTRQCVNVSSRNNQISSIEQISEGNCQ